MVATLAVIGVTLLLVYGMVLLESVCSGLLVFGVFGVSGVGMVTV
jgi:hypothetical protein